MISVLKASVAHFIGNWLWGVNPSYARRLIISRKNGLLARAAMRHYVSCLVPQQSTLEYLEDPKNDLLESLVERQDFEAARRSYESFGFEDRGVFPLETSVLFALVRRYKPDIVLESGTFRGQSAMVLCEAMKSNVSAPRFFTVSPNLEDCLTVARRRLAAFDFATVIEGYSQEEFPKILATCPQARIGVFLDGPKGMDDAFTQLLETLDQSNNIQFIAIHDCQFPVPAHSFDHSIEFPRLERLRIEEWFQHSRMKSTHQLNYMSAKWCHRHADAWKWLPVGEEISAPHYFSGRPQLSPAPVLGLITRKSP